MYTKYHLILQKYNKNNNLSLFRTKESADFHGGLGWGYFGWKRGGGDGKSGRGKYKLSVSWHT